MKPKLNSYWQIKSTVRLYLLALHRALFMRRPVYGSLLFHNMQAAWRVGKMNLLYSIIKSAEFRPYDSAIFLTAARPLLTAGTRITAQVIAPSAKM